MILQTPFNNCLLGRVLSRHRDRSLGTIPVRGKGGHYMTTWYYNMSWGMIEQYIRQEASGFIKGYSIVKNELPKLKLS